MTPKETLVYWIKERESIRIKKEQGLPKPWSDDPIFQTYKFCNVRREDDKVTKWVHENWCTAYQNHPNMWFAMVVARLFNWPDTLDRIGFPTMILDISDWKTRARTILKNIRDNEKSKVFTGAYLVSTNGNRMDKIDYILDEVLTPIWKNGRAPTKGESLEDYWKFLTQFDGLGSFMAGQVIADLKFFDSELLNAVDWAIWAPLGPGSIRGLNRIHERPIEKNIKQEQGLKEMLELKRYVLEETGIPLAVHNVQNCLCETDKYLRLKNNEGKVRSKYPGAK